MTDYYLDNGNVADGSSKGHPLQGAWSKALTAPPTDKRQRTTDNDELKERGDIAVEEKDSFC